MAAAFSSCTPVVDGGAGECFGYERHLLCISEYAGSRMYSKPGGRVTLLGPPRFPRVHLGGHMRQCSAAVEAFVRGDGDIERAAPQAGCWCGSASTVVAGSFESVQLAML